MVAVVIGTEFSALSLFIAAAFDFGNGIRI